MRIPLIVALLLGISFAGCIGANPYTDSTASDLYGNEYQVYRTEGSLPKDGAVVEGITARQSLLAVEDMARDWAEDAHLWMTLGVEIAEGGDLGPGQFIGPTAPPVVHDETPGDGLAPSWNYLFLSQDKLSECEFLFIQAAYNGFLAAFTFNPANASIPDGDQELWGCHEHTAAHSEARWTVDSDAASMTFAEMDSRFSERTATAEVVTWILMLAPHADPEDEATFDTMWATGIFQSTDFANGNAAEGFLTCFTSATNTPTEQGCFEFGEFFRFDGADEEPEVEEFPEPVQPEGGEGTVSFGFVFTTERESTFSFGNDSHPELVLDVSISADQVIPNPYTVALLDPNDKVVDSFNKAANDGASETLKAPGPISGEWTLRITSEGGIPEATYDWCAMGYDYELETNIECPVS